MRLSFINTFHSPVFHAGNFIFISHDFHRPISLLFIFLSFMFSFKLPFVNDL